MSCFKVLAIPLDTDQYLVFTSPMVNNESFWPIFLLSSLSFSIVRDDWCANMPCVGTLVYSSSNRFGKVPKLETLIKITPDVVMTCDINSKSWTLIFLFFTNKRWLNYTSILSTVKYFRVLIFVAHFGFRIWFELFASTLMPIKILVW